VRTKRRVYPSEAHKQRRSGATSPAEYAVVRGKETLARIVRNGSKWIALQVSAENQFGKPVSPLNYVLLREVKEWVIEKYGG